MTNLQRQLKKLPDGPGVYFFERGREILYVGKATSLRDRVRSYFRADLTTARGPWLAKMVTEATGVTFARTDSVLEALILEAVEIKKYQPPYNSHEKDDKSFNHVVITKEAWPRVLVVRGSQLKANTYELKASVGPFPHGRELRMALGIIRKIFPFRDKCVPREARAKWDTPESGKPCFNAQIGLCPGVCAGRISRRDYARPVANLRLFFQGKKQRLLAKLKKEMTAAAKQFNFEQAGVLKKQIFALQHIRDMALIKPDRLNQPSGFIKFRIEAYDIAHLAGGAAVGVMVVVSGRTPGVGATLTPGVQDAFESQTDDYRKFRLRSTKPGDDYGGLREILERRFHHPEWPYPNLIAVDGGRAQLSVAKKVLANLRLNVPLVAVTKDGRHKPKQIIGDAVAAHRYEAAILLANAEAHRFALRYHQIRQHDQSLGGLASK